jgi:hypothetical protein
MTTDEMKKFERERMCTDYLTNYPAQSETKKLFLWDNLRAGFLVQDHAVFQQKFLSIINDRGAEKSILLGPMTKTSAQFITPVAISSAPRSISQLVRPSTSCAAFMLLSKC